MCPQGCGGSSPPFGTTPKSTAFAGRASSDSTSDAPLSAEVVSGRRVQHATSGRDHFGVEVCAVLWRARLRFEVHVHNAEPLRVAVGPFEIIQERPDEISA